MNCKACEFLSALSDEELLTASACIRQVMTARWPGVWLEIPSGATQEQIAAIQAQTINAIPRHLHHLLVTRVQ